MSEKCPECGMYWISCPCCNEEFCECCGMTATEAEDMEYEDE